MLYAQERVNCAESNFSEVHVHSIVQDVAKSGKKKQVQEQGKEVELLDQLEVQINANGAGLNILSIPVDKNTVLINASMRRY